jgi:nitrite reductase/ring-hydroxylating ferredoxin subunit/Fe-S cluster biogenesis protein NfuA
MTDSSQQLPPGVDAALKRLDDLVEKFEMHPDPSVKDRVTALLKAVDTIHRAGLTELSQLLDSAELTGRALERPSVRLLFDLYDLDDGRARIDAVLEAVREHVEDHGGQMEVVQGDQHLVRLRVSGLGHTCEGLPMTQVVEREIRDQLPDLPRLEVENADPPVPPSNFVPLGSLRLRTRPNLVWHAVSAASELSPGTLRGVFVGSASVLLATLDGSVLAYRNRCPGSPLPLHGGSLEGSTLVCPWHHCRFDLRTGSRLDENRQGGPLESVPVSVEQGEVRIGVPDGEAA